MRLVIGVNLVAELLARGIENNGDMFGLKIAQQFLQHVAEAVDRVYMHAIRSRHIRQRVKRAENKAGTVDEVEDFSFPPHGLQAGIPHWKE